MKSQTATIIAAFAAFGLATIGGPAHAKQQTTVVNPPAGSTTEVTQTGDGQTVITVTVNNEAVPFDKNDAPVMMGGRVMVPLRGVVERLGGTIQYDAASRVITGGQANLEKQFRLRVDSDQALVNGKEQTLDTPARVLHGVTYVPLRFVSETLGADVRWDAAKRTVTIMADGYSADVKTASKPAPATP
jgi:hypothetical protein